MKKLFSAILAALLLVTCLLAVSSCGEKADALADFAAIVRNTAVSRVECTVTTKNAATSTTQTAKTVLTAASSEVEYTVLNPLNLDDPTTEMSSSVKVTAKNGTNTIVLGGLNIHSSCFSEQIVEEGVLTGTLSDPDSFFGTDIEATTAKITITTSDGAVRKMNISYTAKNGNAVTVVAVFS